MEFSSQQIQDFLVREFGMFLWLEEALVEDEELQELITSGTPTIVRTLLINQIKSPLLLVFNNTIMKC